MRRVFEHVGVPPVPIKAMSSIEIERQVERVWPTMITTGWQAQGGYAEMDGILRKKLTAFYRPHNRRLELLLGRELGWDA